MTHQAALLQMLSDTDLIIANPSEDIRGRTARDVNGEKIGKIEDLLIDSDDNQVRSFGWSTAGCSASGDAVVRAGGGHQPDHR